MNQKRYQGFTLIELLAVIVILAVIALIATPLIMNVINDAKKGAARDAGYNVIKAGELMAANEGMDGATPPYHYDETSNLDMKGTIPTKFTLDINEDMDTQLKAWLNGYCVVKEYGNETVTIDESKKSEAECVTGGSSVTKKYENGEAIYFNPVTNQKCSNSEAVSTTGTKSGCMKWYAFNDSESSSTVNVILDHNTTSEVEANPSDDIEAPNLTEAMEALTNDTKSWSSSLKARMIGANEIAKITGNTEFDATVSGKDKTFWMEDPSYDIESGDPSEFPQPGKAKYKWLFDYTMWCTEFGCSVADDSTSGYFTGTPYVLNHDYVWLVAIGGVVMHSGNLFGLPETRVDKGIKIGVRPVITISKSLLQ